MKVDYNEVVAMLEAQYNSYVELSSIEKAGAMKAFKQDFVNKYAPEVKPEADYQGDMMYSLYEFLGKAAGADLGKQVFAAAKNSNVPVGSQDVSTRTYTGKVLTYPNSFLREYFG